MNRLVEGLGDALHTKQLAGGEIQQDGLEELGSCEDFAGGVAFWS